MKHVPVTHPVAITADASKVSGADFLRALQGKPPMTTEERAEQRRAAAEYRELCHQEYLAETARIRERTQEMIRKMRERNGR